MSCRIRSQGTAAGELRLGSTSGKLASANSILLLELLQPAGAVGLTMVAVPYSGSKESGFFFDCRVRQRNTLLLGVPYPVRQCAVDIRKFPFGSLHGGQAAIFWKEVLFLLS